MKTGDILSSPKFDGSHRLVRGLRFEVNFRTGELKLFLWEVLKIILYLVEIDINHILFIFEHISHIQSNLYKAAPY